MAGKNTPRMFTSEGRAPVEVEHVVVPPEEGQEHGFVGAVRADKNRDDFTVAGVTVADKQDGGTPPKTSAASPARASKTSSSGS